MENDKIEKINESSKKYEYKKENEKELQRLELNKNIVLRVLDINNKKMIDIRRYYKDFPTKKGIRISYDTFMLIKKVVD